MTMLAHTGGPFKPARYSSGGRDITGTSTANARLAMIKRLSKFALAVLTVGGALASIIALKAAIFLSRLNF
ncbi:hypothetical protein [Bradyrhizobium sp. AZCC 2289]|uniref:hypothetical protein n=1 Tax=Bradyrhizobium sp. AZCC 2289 TaxID=3117026 RepID=UPI002FF1405C